MKPGKYCYDVTVEVTLTGRELRVLHDCAKHHYDSRCKQAAKPGGEVHRLATDPAFEEPPDEVWAKIDERLDREFTPPGLLTTRDLGLLSKILELPTHRVEDEPTRQALHWEISALLHRTGKERDRLNKPDLS